MRPRRGWSDAPGPLDRTRAAGSLKEGVEGPSPLALTLLVEGATRVETQVGARGGVWRLALGGTEPGVRSGPVPAVAPELPAHPAPAAHHWHYWLGGVLPPGPALQRPAAGTDRGAPHGHHPAPADPDATSAATGGLPRGGPRRIPAQQPHAARASGRHVRRHAGRFPRGRTAAAPRTRAANHGWHPLMRLVGADV